MKNKTPFQQAKIFNFQDVKYDVLEDIQGREYLDTNNLKMYNKSVLNTGSKDINETTKNRMKLLKKELKGFKYFIIEK